MGWVRGRGKAQKRTNFPCHLANAEPEALRRQSQLAIFNPRCDQGLAAPGELWPGGQVGLDPLGNCWGTCDLGELQWLQWARVTGGACIAVIPQAYLLAVPLEQSPLNMSAPFCLADANLVCFARVMVCGAVALA